MVTSVPLSILQLKFTSLFSCFFVPPFFLSVHCCSSAGHDSYLTPRIYTKVKHETRLSTRQQPRFFSFFFVGFVPYILLPSLHHVIVIIAPFYSLSTIFFFSFFLAYTVCTQSSSSLRTHASTDNASCNRRGVGYFCPIAISLPFLFFAQRSQPSLTIGGSTI
ncbi:MAG: hypothetical protein JOS17DRAFT_315645 [Linnemannia elongata]|nr:MAG: hypothetical protein JOS17DRAFT_315645 [Linnemannia elongata]